MTDPVRSPLRETLATLKPQVVSRLREAVSAADLKIGRVLLTIEDHQALVAALTVPRCATWQPMETAPKEGFAVLMDERDIRNDAPYRAVCRITSRGYWLTQPGGWRFFPTHWQPLPPPPGSIRDQGER